MRRCNGLIKRNTLEILRDPLSTSLGIAFPIVLLLMFCLINKSTSLPIPVFEVSHLVPGIIILSFAFLMMFCGMLIANDRENSLFNRLQTLPLKPFDFIIGYALPFLPIALMQIVATYLVGFCLGLPFTWGILISIPLLIPTALLFISIGLILGATCKVGPISGIGTILINICTLISGAWFDLSLVSGNFLGKVAYALPFAHSVDATRELIQGKAFNYNHLYFIIGYAVVFVVASAIVFYFRIKGKALHKSKSKVQDN